MQMRDTDRIMSSLNRQENILIEEKNREGIIVRRYKRGQYLGKVFFYSNPGWLCSMLRIDFIGK